MAVPATAVTVPPLQLPTMLGGLATSMAAGAIGKLSIKATPVKSTMLALGLVSVKVNVETPPAAMVDGLKALLIVGGATTVIEAAAWLPMPALLDVTKPV